MARLAKPAARADSSAGSDSADSVIVLAAVDDSSKATPSTAATSVTDKHSPDATAPSEERAATITSGKKKARAATGSKTRAKQVTSDPHELIPPKARTLLGFGFTKNHEATKSKSEPLLHMPKRASPRRVSPRKPSSFLADPSDDESARHVSSSSKTPLLTGQEVRKPTSPLQKSSKKRLAEEIEDTQAGEQEAKETLLPPQVKPHRDLSGATTLVDEDAEEPPTYTESVEKKQAEGVDSSTAKEGEAQNAEEEPDGSVEGLDSKKSMIGKLKGKMASVATTIGKRKRDMKEAFERGKEKLQSHGSRKSTRASKFTGDFLSGLPPLEEERASASEEPPSKKLKRTPASAPALLATTTTAPKHQSTSIGSVSAKPNKPRKHWLTAGMYIGQTRYWDANLTKDKNLKKLKDRFPPNGVPPPERKLLPLPLFHADPDNPAWAGKHWNFVLPFDVYHPLPPGQPKPDEWRKTGTNRVVGDAARVMREINDFKRRETSFCLCKPVEEGGEGCNEDCMNRYMGYQCDEKTCALNAEQCGNRPFAELKERLEGGKLAGDGKSSSDSKTGADSKNAASSKSGINGKGPILAGTNRTRSKEGKKYDVGVEVFKTADKGFGVRANRTFEPGQIITEYAGEMITNDEAERRMVEEYKDAKCYYLLSLSTSTHSTPLIIDGTRGSLARFINHSCTPNSSMIQYSVHGFPRMALFAGPSGIMTGEELTYDYNFDNFNASAVTACRCGSGECRGFLGKKLSEAEVKKRVKEARSKVERESAEEAQRVMEEQRRLEEGRGKKKRKGNWRGYVVEDEEGNVVDPEVWQREREELEKAEMDDMDGMEDDARPRKRAKLTGIVSKKGKDGVTKSRSVLRKKGLKL